MFNDRFSLTRSNRLTLLRNIAMSFFAILFMASLSFAQLSTVYVDETNGVDGNTGANLINSPAGTGPVATINHGLSLLANSGTLVILAGTYNGGDNAGGNIDISTANYAHLTSGLTIQLKSLNNNTVVNLTAGNFIFEIAGGTLTFQQASGTEQLALPGNLTLGSATANSNVSIPTASAALARERNNTHDERKLCVHYCRTHKGKCA